MYDRCIGCGECVRLCPHQAKLPSYDPFDIINGYKYKIALPAPSLYGQFDNLSNVDYVLNGLLEIGFDDVYEVGRGANLCSELTKMLFDRGSLPKPVISTACPAILDLILVRFHDLTPHLLKLLAPVDVSAKLAIKRALEKGIKREDIGVFFISPCPAKVSAIKQGIGVDKPYIDGVLSAGEVYMKLLPVMKTVKLKPLSQLSVQGIAWASSGGEAANCSREKYLAADGMENVIKVLNALEDGQLNGIEFIELNACVGGCVGGVMNVENPFVAKARIRELKRKLPFRVNCLADEGLGLDFYTWEQEPELKDVYSLSTDRVTAMKKVMEINDILKDLPHRDCGMCGAPSCKAFAEDIVNGVIPRDSVCWGKEHDGTENK
jgi:ferredoxin